MKSIILSQAPEKSRSMKNIISVALKIIFAIIVWLLLTASFFLS
ncbi:hypothetical protein RM549_08185 [Salegentibacter sp. F188]|uniref:Uncharacterized protein n=1 Tax=Autumnicola patrickiae TaxID=3075591 RepID=A0ABU3E249_9FLAO|nr:hypothetical protein [Salegentibacter sp. F188]MDT0689759.1 hypothetical protein [Salegentibacter sp. F188]